MHNVQSEKITYVYIDQTNETIPRVFYVGKGKLRRVKDEIRNKKHSAIAKRFGINRVIIFETFDEIFANEIEKLKIIEYGTLAHGYHVSDDDFGSNFTSGGEGFSGVFQEERLRRKNVMTSRWNDQEERKRLIDIQNTESVKKKKSDAMKRWTSSPLGQEHVKFSLEKARLSITKEARAQGQNKEETKQLKSMIMKEYCKDEDVRRNKSEHAKKNWLSEEYRLKQKESRKNVKVSEDVKKRISEKLKGHIVSEETKAKIREAVRLANLRKLKIELEESPELPAS
jgi:hypothetical protein